MILNVVLHVERSFAFSYVFIDCVNVSSHLVHLKFKSIMKSITLGSYRPFCKSYSLGQKL